MGPPISIDGNPPSARGGASSSAAVHGGGDAVLHLHGLQHHQGGAALHGVAGLDRDLDDLAGHGCREMAGSGVDLVARGQGIDQLELGGAVGGEDGELGAHAGDRAGGVAALDVDAHVTVGEALCAHETAAGRQVEEIAIRLVGDGDLMQRPLAAQADLAMALEIADRAALVIDNIQLQEQTQRGATELRHAVKLREDVLAIVSHDLRSPLGTVGLTASALLEIHRDDPRSHKQLETVLRATQQLLRFDLDLDQGAPSTYFYGPNAVLSPDGQRLVFVAEGADGVPRLYVRRLDERASVELPGTEGAHSPFVSASGKWVGFFDRRSLKRVAIDGGAALDVVEVANPRGGSWDGDEHIVRRRNGRVEIGRVEDPTEAEELKALIQKHVDYTGSEHARGILSAWPTKLPKFVRVIPKDYKRVLACLKRAHDQGLSGDEAIMAAFEENARDLSRVGGN